MRIACIADAHGNLYALEKALQHIEQLNVDDIIFLGDAVGYIPGMQVAKHLQMLGMKCIRGNHEDMLLKGGYTPQKDKIYNHSATLERSDRQILAYIESWPVRLEKNDIAFFHASPNDPLNEYIYPDTDLVPYIPRLKGMRYCVVAHTHRPFVRACEDILFVNTGSIGLPRDDGRFGAFAVLDTSLDSAQILRFDISEQTRRSIAEFGPVHESVVNLMHRHAKAPMIGDILDD